MRTAIDYFVCLQEKARDPANLHVTMILGKENCQSERVGWLDGEDSTSQTRAWIEDLVEAGYKPIGFEVIKRDPEVFEELNPDCLDPEAERLLDNYRSIRLAKR